MIEPALPTNELLRLNELRELGILDSPIEPSFDAITRTAQRVFGVDIVAVSLVDESRQWFKSIVGLDACETGRDVSFCGHAILSDEIMCVPDASKDERFFDNPLVTEEPKIRFYAGCPVELSPGNRLGTLCIIDQKPRELTEEDAHALKDLALMVETALACYAHSCARNQLLSRCKLVERQARVDSLTRVLNRRGGEEVLDYVFKEKAPSRFIGVGLIDVDHFKEINDQHGHEVGDLYLQKFASVLVSSCREGDEVIRWGGDEFVVVFNSSDVASVSAMFNRLHREITSSSLQVGELNIPLEASIGVATCACNSCDIWKDVIEAADSAMYKAKEAGRNRLHIMEEAITNKSSCHISQAG